MSTYVYISQTHQTHGAVRKGGQPGGTPIPAGRDHSRSSGVERCASQQALIQPLRELPAPAVAPLPDGVRPRSAWEPAHTRCLHVTYVPLTRTACPASVCTGLCVVVWGLCVSGWPPAAQAHPIAATAPVCLLPCG